MNCTYRKACRNHRLLFFFVCLFCGSMDLQGQVIVRNKIEKNIIFGVHAFSEGFNVKDPATSEVTKENYGYLEPYLGYFFSRNFGVGPILKYHRFRSTFDEDYNHLEVGGFARYYIPIGLNPDLPVTLLFLTEISYRASDFQQINSSDFIQSEGLDYNIFIFTPLGAQIKIWKGLHGELRTDWILHSSGYDEFTLRMGLEYHFSDERREH